MANNDYWGYLRDANELKHYKTPGALNGTTKYPEKYKPIGHLAQTPEERAAKTQYERAIARNNKQRSISEATGDFGRADYIRSKKSLNRMNAASARKAQARNVAIANEKVYQKSMHRIWESDVREQELGQMQDEKYKEQIEKILSGILNKVKLNYIKKFDKEHGTKHYGGLMESIKSADKDRWGHYKKAASVNRQKELNALYKNLRAATKSAKK